MKHKFPILIISLCVFCLALFIHSEQIAKTAIIQFDPSKKKEKDIDNISVSLKDYDQDKNGFVSKTEATELFRNVFKLQSKNKPIPWPKKEHMIGIDEQLSKNNVPEDRLPDYREQAASLFDEQDLNSDGFVSEQEFIDFNISVIEEKMNIDMNGKGMPVAQRVIIKKK